MTFKILETVLRKNHYFIVFFSAIFISSCTTLKDKKTAHHHDHAHHHTNKSHTPDQKKSILNQIIPDLSFSPINANHFKLSNLKKYKAIVFIMREKDCPISEKYGHRVARFEKKYSQKGVQFIFIYTGQVRPNQNAKKDLKQFGFKGPYIIDSKQTVVNTLGAKTTGDVFVLNTKKRLIYKGPVDDQYHLLMRSAPKPKNNYLRDVLENILAGKPITPKELPAPGCVISRPIMWDKLDLDKSKY